MIRAILNWFAPKPVTAPVAVSSAPTPPPLTDKMQSLGFHWRQIGDEWREACNVCGGNCGQCGTSLGMRIPANLEMVIVTTGMNQPVAGLRRG